MNEHQPPDVEQRRLVQQIVNGRIPAGGDFDECRAVLRSSVDDKAHFQALFTLLRGALADPFLGIEETARIVPVLRDLARGHVSARKLL